MCIGPTTYEWMLNHDPELLTGPERWEAFYGDRRRGSSRTGPTSHGRRCGDPVLQGDVRPVHDQMRARRDGDVWIIGGGELVGQFDDAGLLDRVILGMCPVTLGAGPLLLPRRITSERMHVTDVRLEGQQVRIVLDLDRKAGQPGEL